MTENIKKGYISLYRSILTHWLFPKNKPLTDFEAWIFILLSVNHASTKVRIKGVIYDCKRGQSLMSLDSWAKCFNWNKSKVRRFLKLLQNDSMIELKSDTITTQLTVCNYDSYQVQRNTNETQVKHKRNASETQTTPNNNDNNDNNNIEIRAKKFGSTLEPFIKDENRSEIHKFWYYWTEKSKSGKKLRFEMEKTWDTSRRLQTWLNNTDKFNK